MQNEQIAAAYQNFQRQLDQSYITFVTSLTQNSWGIDPKSLMASGEKLGKLQHRLTGVLLLPVVHPQLSHCVDTLYQMYSDVINSVRTKRSPTALRKTQREDVIVACKLLILEGKPFTFAVLCQKAGMHQTTCNEAFMSGFKEIREIAFEQLISEAKADIGIEDTRP